MKSGFLYINKPTDWTSHDVVAHLRRVTGEKKIGHAGTLDPFATGLLIIGVGREATRELDKFLKQDKEYFAELHLGAVSDTYDLTGEIKKSDASPPTEDDVKNILKKFLGEQEQIPPMYSAKKIAGKKLYELARKGKEIEREPNKIIIHELNLLNYDWPKLKIRVKCSSGTYIRSLAHDIGQKLNAGAYLEKLERTKIGAHELKDAVDLKKINQNNWQEFVK
jgi:tRNA pseudouridine55 synthase